MFTWHVYLDMKTCTYLYFYIYISISISISMSVSMYQCGDLDRHRLLEEDPALAGPRVLELLQERLEVLRAPQLQHPPHLSPGG